MYISNDLYYTDVIKISNKYYQSPIYLLIKYHFKKIKHK